MGRSRFTRSTDHRQFFGRIGIIAALGALALTFAAPPAVAAPTVISTIRVGSSPFFVTTNTLSNAAYVTNFNDNTVSVINVRKNTVAATIPVGSTNVLSNNAYGVAANPLTNTIYVTNYTEGAVSVINGRNNTMTAVIPRRQLPDRNRDQPANEHRLRDQHRLKGQLGVRDQWADQ